MRNVKGSTTRPATLSVISVGSFKKTEATEFFAIGGGVGMASRSFAQVTPLTNRRIPAAKI